MKSIAALAAAASLGIASYANDVNADYYDEQVAVQMSENVYPDEYRLITLASTLVIDGPLKCGLGAWINGTDFEECIGPALFGGLVDYMGMEIARYNDTPFVGAAGKLIHDLGVSMSDNAALGIPMFDRFQTDFGPVLFSIEHMTTDPTFNVYFQIMPAVGMIANFAEGNRFEVLESLYNLTPVFSFENVSSEHFGTRYVGYTMGNVMAYGRGENVEGYSPRVVRSHEFNHTLAYGNFRFINDLLPSYPMEKLHLSFGPDLATLVLALPSNICFWAEGDCYGLYMSNPLEFFAYSMQND
ncbi:MAG: hypothetical protein V1734_05960 [Nanoarchaeota archaeon]